MTSRVERRAPVARRAGVAVRLVGAGFVGGGVWGRREAARALARERIVHPGEGSRAVTSAGGARSLAEFIRRATVDVTGGRTFAEVEPYVDAVGAPTTNRSQAAMDALTGGPAENRNTTPGSSRRRSRPPRPDAGVHGLPDLGCDGRTRRGARRRRVRTCRRRPPWRLHEIGLKALEEGIPHLPRPSQAEFVTTRSRDGNGSPGELGPTPSTSARR